MNKFMNKFTSIFNFDNIGKKIKAVAKWSCWIEIALVWIGAAISFIYFLANDYLWDLLWIPFVAAIFAPVIIWLSYWMIYAFGELVDNSIIANQNNSANQKTVNTSEPKRVEKQKNKVVKINADTSEPKRVEKQKNKVVKINAATTEFDENEFVENEFEEYEFVDVTCPHCNENLSYSKIQLQRHENVICPMCNSQIKL